MTLTLEILRDLNENQVSYRYSRTKSERRRAPRLPQLVAFIQSHFGGLYETELEDWSHQNYRKTGRIRTWEGKIHKGPRLTVRLAGQPYSPRDFVFQLNLADPYHTTWEVVSWIVSAAKSTDSPPPQ